jgi:hypothetical protein
VTYPAATSALQQAWSLYSLQYELEVMVVFEATSCVIGGGMKGGEVSAPADPTAEKRKVS